MKLLVFAESDETAHEERSAEHGCVARNGACRALGGEPRLSCPWERASRRKWPLICPFFLPQISDDEDDTHPNVDTQSLFRWRHQARLEREEKERQEKAKRNAEIKLLGGKERETERERNGKARNRRVHVCLLV
jgi:hypothetical protein